MNIIVVSCSPHGEKSALFWRMRRPYRSLKEGCHPVRNFKAKMKNVIWILYLLEPFLTPITIALPRPFSWNFGSSKKFDLRRLKTPKKIWSKIPKCHTNLGTKFMSRTAEPRRDGEEIGSSRSVQYFKTHNRSFNYQMAKILKILFLKLKLVPLFP